MVWWCYSQMISFWALPWKKTNWIQLFTVVFPPQKQAETSPPQCGPWQGWPSLVSVQSWACPRERKGTCPGPEGPASDAQVPRMQVAGSSSCLCSALLLGSRDDPQQSLASLSVFSFLLLNTQASLPEEERWISNVKHNWWNQVQNDFPVPVFCQICEGLPHQRTIRGARLR